MPEIVPSAKPTTAPTPICGNFVPPRNNLTAAPTTPFATDSSDFTACHSNNDFTWPASSCQQKTDAYAYNSSGFPLVWHHWARQWMLQLSNAMVIHTFLLLHPYHQHAFAQQHLHSSNASNHDSWGN
jgi:hypothetical protein